MQIAYREIWELLSLIDVQEKGWSFNLVAGNTCLENIAPGLLQTIQADEEYDTELLPSIFTFREILWQPDVYTEAAQSLPPLRILKAHCDEESNLYLESNKPTLQLYGQLLTGISKHVAHAISKLDLPNTDVRRELGDLRSQVFPVIKFFVYHPCNRKDYHHDAINRLNYAVKVILTDFYGKYTDLKNPYWEVVYKNGDAYSSDKNAIQINENA